MKTLLWKGLNSVGLAGVLQLVHRSHLRDIGWFRSARSGESVDALGRPLPWCTYPFIAFLEPRVHRGLNVFEYGCGNSTRWYAERAGRVDSVEHDGPWFNRIARLLPENAQVTLQPLDLSDRYEQTIAGTGERYHIVVIDGRRRVQCIAAAMPSLTPNGVVVLDNSDRARYATGAESLRESGFHRLDFWGQAPVKAHLTCTSIFYRRDNCLDI